MPTIQTNEGGVIGETYGECIPAPQLLMEHVETVGNDQYLNLLLCGGYGPVDAIYDLRIGNTAIGNFQDVMIETRLGTMISLQLASYSKQFQMNQSVLKSKLIALSIELHLQKKLIDLILHLSFHRDYTV